MHSKIRRQRCVLHPINVSEGVKTILRWDLMHLDEEFLFVETELGPWGRVE
jgi:hypothetical protein